MFSEAACQSEVQKGFYKVYSFSHFFISLRESKALRPSLWSGVVTKTVDKLPFDIDGLIKYQLIFDKERRMESSLDGRPWAGFMTSQRSGFTGTRRLAR